MYFPSRSRHTRLQGDWSSDVCSSDLLLLDQHRDVGAESLVQQHALQKLQRAAGTYDAPAVEGLLLHGTPTADISVWLVLPRSEERRVGKACRSLRCSCDDSI